MDLVHLKIFFHPLEDCFYQNYKFVILNKGNICVDVSKLSIINLWNIRPFLLISLHLLLLLQGAGLFFPDSNYTYILYIIFHRDNGPKQCLL